MFLLYDDIRASREGSNNPAKLAERVVALESVDWLALYDTLELVLEHQGDESIRTELVNRLKLEVGDNAVLIMQGLQRLQGFS
jgi:hypothetical protein